MTEQKEEEIDRTSIIVYYKDRGQVELKKEFPEEGYLWNKDFHPTPIKLRTWGAWTYLAICFGMVVIVPTWTLSAVGLAFGLNWWQSIQLLYL